MRLARQIALLEHDALAGVGVDDGDGSRRTSIPLAVNADSMATWFLAPLARLSAATRHRLRSAPRRSELHRHGCSSRAR